MGCTVDVGSGMRARRSGHKTQAIRHADALEAQLALKRADHLLQFAALRPLGPIAWAFSLTFSRRVLDRRADRGRAPIIRRLPSAAMGRNPLAGSAHVPACNRSISPTTGDGPRAVSATGQ